MVLATEKIPWQGIVKKDQAITAYARKYKPSLVDLA